MLYSFIFSLIWALRASTYLQGIKYSPLPVTPGSVRRGDPSVPHVLLISLLFFLNLLHSPLLQFKLGQGFTGSLSRGGFSLVSRLLHPLLLHPALVLLLALNPAGTRVLKRRSFPIPTSILRWPLVVRSGPGDLDAAAACCFGPNHPRQVKVTLHCLQHRLSNSFKYKIVKNAFRAPIPSPVWKRQPMNALPPLTSSCLLVLSPSWPSPSSSLLRHIHTCSCYQVPPAPPQKRCSSALLKPRAVPGLF